MKIIATIGSDKFLVEVFDSELAKIMGHEYLTTAKEKGCKIESGREVAVSDLWKALSVTRGRMEEVTKLAADLRRTADRVDSINAALKAPIVEVKAC